MRKNFGVKTYLYPQPVLVIGTYDKNGNPNVMTAAWGGISDYDKITIALAQHKTTDNILINKAFTISIGTKKEVAACDYVGLVSANDESNKFEKSGFTANKSEFVNAPIVNELPLTIECELLDFNTETEVLVGKIVNVSADESILTNGNIDLNKFDVITYDPANHKYVALGEDVADAFKVGLSLK